jgi:hypothetical protein
MDGDGYAGVPGAAWGLNTLGLRVIVDGPPTIPHQDAELTDGVGPGWSREVLHG